MTIRESLGVKAVAGHLSMLCKEALAWESVCVCVADPLGSVRSSQKDTPDGCEKCLECLLQNQGQASSDDYAVTLHS